MKWITCPLNGLRPEHEFSYGGLIRLLPQSTDDGEWLNYLMPHDEECVWEWWCHLPSVYWFVVNRDLLTDTWLETMSMEEARERGIFK